MWWYMIVCDFYIILYYLYVLVPVLTYIPKWRPLNPNGICKDRETLFMLWHSTWGENPKWTGISWNFVGLDARDTLVNNRNAVCSSRFNTDSIIFSESLARVPKQTSLLSASCASYIALFSGACFPDLLTLFKGEYF
jgi:hypothetical protein